MVEKRHLKHGRAVAHTSNRMEKAKCKSLMILTERTVIISECDNRVGRWMCRTVVQFRSHIISEPGESCGIERFQGWGKRYMASH